ITSLTIMTPTGDLNPNGWDFLVDTITITPGMVVPAPVIGHGLPVLLAVGGILFGAKLLGRSRQRRSLGTAAEYGLTLLTGVLWGCRHFFIQGCRPLTLAPTRQAENPPVRSVV